MSEFDKIIWCVGLSFCICGGTIGIGTAIWLMMPCARNVWEFVTHKRKKQAENGITLWELQARAATIPFHDLSDGKGACVVCFKDDLQKAIVNLMEEHDNDN